MGFFDLFKTKEDPNERVDKKKEDEESTPEEEESPSEETEEDSTEEESDTEETEDSEESEDEDETMSDEQEYTVTIGYEGSNEDEGTNESTKAFNNLDAKEAKDLMTQLNTQLADETKKTIFLELDETKTRCYAAFTIEKTTFLYANAEADE